MRFTTVIAAYLVVFGLQSCRFREIPDDVAEFPAEFELRISELLGADDRDCQLVFNSVEQYCDSTSILFQKTSSAASFGIELKAIAANNDCSAPSIRAFAAVSLGALANGNYDISIVLRDALTSTGQLMVSDEVYELQLFQKEGISLFNQTIRRVPEGLVWGEIWFDDAAEAKANSFLAEFAMRTQMVSLAQGNYGYFSFGKEGMLTDNLYDFSHKMLFWGIATQTENLLTLAEETNAMLGSHGTLTLNTWKGEHF